MAFDIIYFFILLVYAVWFLAIFVKDDIVAMFASFLLFALSIYMFSNGIDRFPSTELLVIMFSAVTFALAAMTSLTAGYNMYRDL